MAMARKALLWLEARRAPVGDRNASAALGSPARQGSGSSSVAPLPQAAHGWLPDPADVLRAVRLRFPALRAEHEDLVGEFYAVLLQSLQPYLALEAEVPNLGKLYWMYANALHKAASRRKNLFVEAAGDTGQESAAGDELEGSQGAPQAAEQAWYLGVTVGLAKFEEKLLRLYELSRPQATMLLELAFLGKVDVPAWARVLQAQSAEPPSRNACNIMVTKQTAMAVFRFLVLLHDVAQTYEKRVQKEEQGPLPPMPAGCDSLMKGWDCFALAYFTPGIPNDKAAAAEAARLHQLSPKVYRAARSNVSRWVLEMLSAQPSAKDVLAEYRDTLVTILNLPKPGTPMP